MPKYKPYKVFSKKETLKSNKGLVELHKRVITTYLVQRDLKLKTRKKFFRLYDLVITAGNINQYFFLPVRILVTVIVLDQTDNINKYLQEHGTKIRKGFYKPKKVKSKSDPMPRKIPIQAKIGSVIAKPKYPNNRYRIHY